MSFAVSAAGLVLINAAAIVIAWWQHWPLVALLWPYWLQSVVIGWYSRKRILALKQFSLEGTSGFDKGSDEETRRSTARFFVMHYGVFHLGYLFFLCIISSGGFKGVAAYNFTGVDLLLTAALGVSFVFAHRATYARVMDNDQASRPNIGGVMFLPYLRIVPMHLTLIVGLTLGYAGSVILFGALKTAADILMAWVEQRITSPTAEPGAQSERT